MVVEELLGEICHQLPARCLVVAGVVMPACARCSGIYLGTLFAAACYAVPGKRPLFLHYPSPGAAAFAAAATVPCAADMFLSLAGYPVFGGNGARFVAGLFAGWGAWILLAGAATWLRWGAAPERRLDVGRVAGSLAALLVPGLLVATPLPAAAKIFAWATLAGTAAFCALLSYLPLALFLHKKRYRPAAGLVILSILVVLAAAEMKWGNAVYEGLSHLIRQP
jgi:uncharacterized membrane protein